MGSGSKVSVGDTTGTEPRELAKYPTLRDTDKAVTYNPSNQKYYFVRGTTLMEFNPETKRTTVIRSPANTVALGPAGNIVFASPDRKVSYRINFYYRIHFYYRVPFYLTLYGIGRREFMKSKNNDR